MKRIIYQTVGCQASGKSSWAKQFVVDNKDTLRVSRDDIRHSLNNYQFTSENEKIVDKLYRGQICILLDSTNKNIILDEMNLNENRRKEFQEWMKSITKDELEFEIKKFPVTLGEAIERDSKREFSLGKNILKQTWNKYEIVLKQMIEEAKPKIEYDRKLEDAWICDIDGTLAKSLHRKQYDEKEVGSDEIIISTAGVLGALKGSNERYKIIIVSGRQESCRAETENWLRHAYIKYDALFMRKTGDQRKDTIVKKEIYDEHIKDKYNIAAVFDDRPSVIKMWIDLGLFVFNCNQDPYCKNDF